MRYYTLRTDKFGRRLTLCRVLTNITQEELAEALGVTQGTVAAWELGWYRPREKRWARIISTFRELNNAGIGDARQ